MYTTQTTPAEEFFYENAGYSYDPRVETREKGRRRCAVALARAEAWAREQEVDVVWEADWEGWSCLLAHPDGRVASLHAIEFGEQGEDDPYRRVVQAELALELMRSE